MEPQHRVDARGLSCPMPIVRARQAMKQAEVGDVVLVLATDRGARSDFRAWAEQTENTLLRIEEQDGVLFLYLRKLVAEVEEKGRLWDVELTNDELAADLLREDAPLVLDVREVEEFRAGHIPGAVHIPIEEIEAHLDRLDRGRRIAVVCRSGNRSGYACRILGRAGFQAVHNVVPGMTAWRGPVEGR